MTPQYDDPRLPLRFWSKVHPEPNTGCWLWGASTFPNTGHGQFWWEGRNRSAHRVAYEVLVGAVADELVIDHACNQRACVRPDHLVQSTQRDNILRGTSMAARHARRERCDQGHPLAGENLYIVRTRPNVRVCRTCKIERERQRWARVAKAKA